MGSCLHDSLLCVKNSPHVPCPAQIINLKMILSSIHDDDLIRYRRLNGYTQDAWPAIYKTVNSKWNILLEWLLLKTFEGENVVSCKCWQCYLPGALPNNMPRDASRGGHEYLKYVPRHLFHCCGRAQAQNDKTIDTIMWHKGFHIFTIQK